MTYRHLLIFVYTHIYTYTQVYVCTHTLKLYCLLDMKEIHHRKYVLGVHPLWPGVLPVSLAGCVLELSQLMGTDPGASTCYHQSQPSLVILTTKPQPLRTCSHSKSGPEKQAREKKQLHFRSKHFEEKKKEEGHLRVREIDSFLTNEVKIIHSCPFLRTINRNFSNSECRNH